MDAVADVLQPYKKLVGNVAAVVTIGQMFSGSFICWDIYKQGSSKGVGIMPFLGGIVIGIVGLQFAFILHDDKMIQVNVFGLALNVIHIAIYLHYSDEKKKDWTEIGLGGLFAAVILGYARIEDPSQLEAKFGIIMTVLMFTLLASPLFGLRDIIKNKSTEGMPFPIILSGTVVTFAWLLYGIILRNKFLVGQNLVALALCSVQLALFVIYPSKARSEDKKIKTRKVE